MATLDYSYFLEASTATASTPTIPEEGPGRSLRPQMKDKPVQIRYKPSNPDKSVLEQRTIEQHILLTPRFG